MSTSGTSVWTAQRNDILRQAALLLGIIAARETLKSEDEADLAFNLNAMVKTLQATGIHLWTVAEATLFLNPGQTVYRAGTGATDHITESFVQSAVTTAAASGSTLIAIDDTSGMANNDTIGIVLDDGTLHWSTALTISSGLALISAALPDSTAATNHVFAYTSKIVRPLKITHARRYNIESQTDTPMEVVARSIYRDMPLKGSAGTPNQLFYDPQLGQGLIHVWQVPVTATESLIKFTWHRPIQDFNASSNTPDLPQEWIMPLYYNLANYMLPQYAVSDRRARQIERRSAALLETVLSFDRESEPTFIQPDIRSYG